MSWAWHGHTASFVMIFLCCFGEARVIPSTCLAPVADALPASECLQSGVVDRKNGVIMTEKEILARIVSMNGSRDGAILAGFWLLMGSRHDIRLFTLGDLRMLSGDSRSLFHAINQAYSSQRFTALSPAMATRLMSILVDYEHEHARKKPFVDATVSGLDTG